MESWSFSVPKLAKRESTPDFIDRVLSGTQPPRPTPSYLGDGLKIRFEMGASSRAIQAQAMDGQSDRTDTLENGDR